MRWELLQEDPEGQVRGGTDLTEATSLLICPLTIVRGV